MKHLNCTRSNTYLGERRIAVVGRFNFNPASLPQKAGSNRDTTNLNSEFDHEIVPFFIEVNITNICVHISPLSTKVD